MYTQHLQERQRVMREQAWQKLNKLNEATESKLEQLNPVGLESSHHPAGSDMRGIVSEHLSADSVQKPSI